MTLLTESTLECIERVYESRRVAKCKVGSIELLRIAKNARDKDIIDPELIAVNFSSNYCDHS